MGKLDYDFYDEFYRYYDHLNDGREDERAYYWSILSPEDIVLEAACGSGSLTITIADRCREVVGFDISEPMLAQARQRLPGCSFHWADMRTVDLGRTFDTVLCPFNSLMHMHSDEDALAALGRLRAHCAETGRVIVDLFDISPQYMAPRTENVQVLDMIESDGGRRLLGFEDSIFEAGTLTLTIRIVEASSGAQVGRSSFSMRFYDRAHLTNLFQRAGLDPVRIDTGYVPDAVRAGARQIYHAVPTRS